MIDIRTEKLLSLTRAARRLPRRRAGRKVAASTLYRWSAVGCRGIRLETVQVGGTRCTSLEALGRFFAALAAQARLAGDSKGRNAQASDVVHQQRVDAELDRHGL